MVLIFFGSQGCRAGIQETLGAKEFNEKIGQPGIQLIDLRTAIEFETGYIAKAENIDFYDPDFLKRMAELDKSKPLALYCKSGGRTKEALKVLSKEGFEKIYTLRGGLLEWEKMGLPLVMPKPVEPVKTTVSQEEYNRMIKAEKLVIIEFGATWCGPCRLLKPVLDKVSADYASKGVKIINIDVDDSKSLSNALLVNEIPLVLFYLNGELKEQMIGFNPEEVITQTIEKYLKG